MRIRRRVTPQEAIKYYFNNAILGVVASGVCVITLFGSAIAGSSLGFTASIVFGLLFGLGSYGYYLQAKALDNTLDRFSVSPWFIVALIVLIVATATMIKLRTCTIEFDLNGGSLVSGELVQKVKAGEDAVPPKAVNGSRKLSWDGNYKAVDGNRTITAKWEIVEELDFLDYAAKRMVTVSRGDLVVSSGVVIDEDGLIATVIDDGPFQAGEVTVCTADGTRFDKVTTVRYFESARIVVLKIEAKGLTSFDISEKNAQVNDTVYVIGPEGNLGQGTILDNRTHYEIELTKEHHSVFYGGPMVNCYGELLGIITTYYNPLTLSAAKTEVFEKREELSSPSPTEQSSTKKASGKSWYCEKADFTIWLPTKYAMATEDHIDGLELHLTTDEGRENVYYGQESFGVLVCSSSVPDSAQLSKADHEHHIQYLLDWEKSCGHVDLGHGILETQDAVWDWISYNDCGKNGEVLMYITYLNGYSLEFSFRNHSLDAPVFFTEEEHELCESVVSSLRRGKN